jgi:uncharacterized protein (TIGR02145 family)
MKPRILLTLLFLSVLGICTAQKPTLILSFSANNIGQPVPLDSILIENLTQGVDTTLFAPDTVLMLDYITGQYENAISGEKELFISQNYPNPISDQTKVDVYLPENTAISVRIYDLVGRTLLTRSYQLNSGFHTFNIQAGSESVYFLAMDAASQSKTIKLINAPGTIQTSAGLGLEYLGVSAQGQFNHKTVAVQGNFVFNLGDELKFTASTALGELAITAIPEENQAFTFEYYVTGTPCPDMPTVTDIDGNVYNTVLIGEQCWLKENLRTTHYRNGTEIPYPGSDDAAWNSNTSGAYAWYNNDIEWKDSYGALYNWYATVNENGLCPTGWHVPTHDEWTVLTDFIGGLEAPHGNELRSCKQLNAPLPGGCNTAEHPRWDNHNTNYGTDDYGFALLPTGYRGGGPFFSMGNNTHLWSSTNYGPAHAYGRNLYLGNGAMGVYSGQAKNGFAIRCVRD